MAGGFAGILLLEIISKTVDLYSILRGDWDLALKPKASKYQASLLLGAPRQQQGEKGKEEIRFPHPPSRFTTRDPYKVLGIKNKSSDLSLSNVKTAYRQLIGIYHPDLFAKCSKEIQDEATRRAKIINAAYHTLRSKF
ncbi:DnaJ family molecular chaperone [Synechococcus sp. 8F6]|uniref:J domain-containing protein n=1 Tax=Synechococcus sp. 8F6 TaxID=2025606 RepID=UPI0013038AEA|nr:J domain-containing protein [Synechococcus sp. 8F6]